MVKKMLAWVLLAMLAVTSVGCTDGEEEENWWEVDREEILLVVEIPGGTPERVERRMGGSSGASQSVTVPYKNGELIELKYSVYYKGELRNDVYVNQLEEYYLEPYEEWTRWAELRAKGEYKVELRFYSDESLNVFYYVGSIGINLTIQ